MKAFKYRDKYLLLLKKELKKIHLRCNLLNIRRSVRKVDKYLNEIEGFLERYDSDVLAVKSVKIKNIHLAQAVQNERVEKNKLLQEKLEVQSAYHDALKEKAELKKELYNLEQTIITDLDDLKNVLPNIVELSENYTRRMMKYDILRKNISAKRGNELLRHRSFPNISFGTNSTQPISAVNPMVQGCVIQKPTIAVRRVPFPNETRNSLFEYVNVDSPIMEEPEENVSSINNLNRRCENGLNAVSSSSRGGTRRSDPSINTSSEIGYRDSVNTDNQMSMRMEPVVRLEDVTRLLQNSSLRISETNTSTPTIENKVMQQSSPEVVLQRSSTSTRPVFETTDNVLEECSWMYQRPSINVHDDKTAHPSLRSNTYSYQSNVQLAPSFVRSTPMSNRKRSNNIDDAIHPQESTYLVDETQSSHRASKKLFQRSPLRKKSLAEGTRDVDRVEIQMSNSYDDGDALVVSSSNQDLVKGVVSTFGITQRKHKKVLSARSGGRFSEIENCISENSTESVEERRPRRSTKVLKNREFAETSKGDELQGITKYKSVSKKSIRRRNPDDTGLRDMISENKEIVEERRKRDVKSSSKRSLSVSNNSHSDLEDGSRPMRSARNRSSVSYKEPSLNVKLRRDV